MIWKPNPGPQEFALITTAYETLYGGARGGGKTDAGIVWIAKPELITNPRYRGLVIRKNADDLRDWVDRASLLYTAFGGVPVGKPTIFRFPWGSKIITGHLKDDNAYTKYQGHEYHRMLIEELTQIGEERNYDKLLGSNRSTVAGLQPRIFCTTNPGGVGHAWVKNRFIDPAEWNKKFTANNGRTRIFIQSSVEDTPQILQNDPGYVQYLDGLQYTDPELYKAWRLGDWDVFAGQYFREFSRIKHVMKRFSPNMQRNDFVFMGGLDWGREAPFSFHAAIVYPVKYVGVDKSNPELNDGVVKEHKFYRAITFREVYGTDKNPGEWSVEIKRMLGPYFDKIGVVQCDNQIFAPGNDKSMSIFEQFCAEDERWRGKMKAATKDRIGGWTNMHNWLSVAPDGLPYWLMTDDNLNLIRTLPTLIHDEVNVEDVDGAGEDHAADDQRYMFSGFRWLDGKLGAMRYGSNTPKPKLKTPVLVDLDKFATAGKRGLYSSR